MSETTGGGSRALEGFLYQVDVSVYAALDLLIDRRRAERLVLEPVREDDIEGDLADTDASLMEGRAALGPRTLIVQAKLRSEPWTPGAVGALLKHGKRRTPASTRLVTEQDTGYLLVTSSDVSAEARDLIVSGFGRWPERRPRSFADLDPAILSRVAILNMRHADFLLATLRGLIVDQCGVPFAQWGPCLEALRADATARMRGVAAGVWTRAEVASVISAHEGRPERRSDLPGFVRPTNWAQMREAVRRDNVILIDGHSGTGKTTTAEALAEELRAETPGARVVRISNGPDQILTYTDPGPVIFLLEDPWGRYSLAAAARPWNISLQGILDGRNRDRRFIVTSRLDILGEAKARLDVTRWSIRLESGHYGRAEWHQMFELWRGELPAAHQVAIAPYEGDIVESLSTPFQLRRFFAAAAKPRPENEPDHGLVYRCLASAQEEAIEREVQEQIEERNATAAAAILWAMLATTGRARRHDLEDVGRALARREREFEDAVPKLLRISRGAGNLHGDDDALAYAHPRIEKAFAATLRDDNADATARRLGLLLTVLTDEHDFPGDWGPQTAATILQAARRNQIPIFTTPAGRAAVNRWLDRHLAGAGEDIRAALELAAAAGTTPAAEVAAWLTNIDIGRMFAGGQAWTPTRDEPTWYEARAAEPLTRALCEAFVEYVLPQDRIGYPHDFTSQLAQLCPGLGDAFRRAACRVVGYGYFSPASMITAGGLDDLDAFSVVLDAALDIEAKVRAEDHSQIWLDFENGVYPADYEQHLAETQGEDGHTAGAMIEAFAEALRSRRGWAALDTHPRAAELADGWLTAIRRSALEAIPAEWTAVARHAFDGPHEARLWDVAAPKHYAAYASQLARRLAAGHPNLYLRRHVAQVFRALALADQAAAATVFAGRPRQALAFAADLEVPDDFGLADADANAPAVAAIAAVLDPPSRAAFLALFRSAAPPPPHAIPILLATADAPGSALLLRAGRALAAAGADVSAHVERLLTVASSDLKSDTEGGLWAVEMLAAQGDWPGVRRGLDHRMADVRIDALRRLDKRLDVELTEDLLRMATDRSARVINVALDLIASRLAVHFVPLLLDLTNNTWRPSIDFYPEDADYPIARRAAVLLQRADLAPAELTSLLDLARATDDSDLRRELLVAIGRADSAGGGARLVDQLLDRSSVPMAVAAAAALYELSDTVSPAEVARIDIKNLLRRPAVAAEISLLVGAAGAPEQTLAFAQKVLNHPRRRPLALLLAAGAVGRLDDGTQEAVLGLFEPDFRPAFLAAAADGPKLTRDRIPSGDPVVEAVVARHLKFMLEPPDAVSAPGADTGGSGDAVELP